MKMDFLEGWAHEPLLAEAFADRLRTAQARLAAELGAPAPVLFTAHSVPCRTIQTPAANPGQPVHWPAGRPGAAEGTPDPYPVEAKLTAAAVAKLVPEIPAWYFAFQSQGASGGPWIGPPVQDTLDALAASGEKAVMLQPIGFLCDHVEILYDIDIDFKEHAAKLGLRLERPESLNGSPILTQALVKLSREGLARLEAA
jgi:ferrochelatase